MRQPKKDPFWIAQVKLEGVVLRLYENIIIHKDKNWAGKRSFWPNDARIASNMRLLKELWKEIEDSEGKE